MGFDAGKSISTGTKNTAIGSYTLGGDSTITNSNTGSNVAIGYYALRKYGATNGDGENVAVGYDAFGAAATALLRGVAKVLGKVQNRCARGAGAIWPRKLQQKY